MQSIKEIYKIGKGPSSSHTIGVQNGAKYIKNKYPNASKIECYFYGSISLTGKGHLSDVAVYEILPQAKIYFTKETLERHPNGIRFVIDDKYEEIIYSVGGGDIEIGDNSLVKEEIYKENSFEEIKNYCLSHNISLIEYIYQNEKDLKEYLLDVYKVMMKSIERGLENKGELPGTLHVKRKANDLFHGSFNIMRDNSSLVSAYAYAVAEENASGGIVVTAPTCGSSGVIPSILKYLKDTYLFEESKLLDALAIAGLIGNIIKQNASLSGAMLGCQAEIGSATAMASAMVAFLFDMDMNQIEYASESSIEHQLGLTCDPIGGYVQIPCIERNAVAALRAIDCAKLAYYISDSRKISLDMIIKTMKETGLDLSKSYKETSLA